MAPEFRLNWIIGAHGFQENINLPREVLNCYTYANQHTVSAPATLTPTHNLRPKEEVNYRSQHLGQEIKQAAKELKQEFKKWCKSMRKTAKRAVTRLAPGAFSPAPKSANSPPKLTYPFVVIIYRRLLLKINIASTVLETLLTLVRLKIYQTFKTSTTFLPFRTICCFYILHPYQGTFQLYA
jgi:hypothetical protein